MAYISIFLIQIIVCLLFCFIAAYTDLKRGIISNRLNLILLVFGLSSNLILSVLFYNSKYILASIISLVITFTLAYMFWKLKIWGGGDVKLFTAISSVIPSAINMPFLGIYPQLSFYPFTFTIMINSILVSFPFLIILTFYLNSINSVFRINLNSIFYLANFNNFLMFLNKNFNKTIDVNNLKEGMIINNYYFNDYRIFQAIKEINGNLEVYNSKNNSNYLFYFKSQSAGGITIEEMYLLKILYAQDFISNNISIKLAFPFAPSIAIGFLIAITYGDLVLIISTFLKTAFMVI